MPQVYPASKLLKGNQDEAADSTLYKAEQPAKDYLDELSDMCHESNEGDQVGVIVRDRDTSTSLNLFAKTTCNWSELFYTFRAK
mmetsp:Transcript_12423/g.16844  ORF Transcript_12423/g.16844 Transcript_12423/m.16844 type:complete len:84 (+) Transcript_12423:908-1159(+)